MSTPSRIASGSASKPSTRDRMLDAASHVMSTRGLARATTKEIAKAAGFSEAALYKHFDDKTEIFLAVLTERVPGGLAMLLSGLGDRTGKGSLQKTLEEVARAAIIFYDLTFPMAASLFSDPELLAAHRAEVFGRGAGPAFVSSEVATYLAAEQRIGRIRPDADARAAAALLAGGCLQYAFLNAFAGDQIGSPAVRRLAAGLVKTVMVGLVGPEKCGSASARRASRR